MERCTVTPRSGWQGIVESQGLIWHSEAGAPYWDESAYYAFTLAEIERIEAASETLYGLFLEAGEYLVSRPERLAPFGIPDWCYEPIRQAWQSEPPALNYGRFDLGYDGRGDPKLFEFNCDTPTALLEAAIIQWNWMEDLFPNLDQYNSLHERLIERWAEIRQWLPGNRIWFSHAADPMHEDVITTTYLRDLAAQAGLETLAVVIDDIGLDRQGRIVDLDEYLITAIYKLYPWEWIVREQYGRDVVRHLPTTVWVEPIWKMLWSNKAILPVLWELFPDHPNLLAASTEAGVVGSSYVSKPALAREGANIEIVEDGAVVERTEGEYRDGTTIYQARYPLKDFGRGYPVLGAWVVNGQAAGMGIREDGMITGNAARFVPHVIRG